MANLKVLLCGAGIAGNALAFWLAKLGYHITVVERFPELRTNGLQVDLRGHAISVMRLMGIEKQFRDRAVPEQGLEFVNSSGSRRAYFPINESSQGIQSFSTNYEIMRGDLCRILQDLAKGAVNYVFGTYVQSYEEAEDGVNVMFSDGKKGKFDLLVGADGQGSRTRKMMLEPGAPSPVHNIGAYELSIWPLAAATRRHTKEIVQVYLGCSDDGGTFRGVRRGDTGQEEDALVDNFRGANWQTDRIIKALREETNDFYCEQLGVVKLDSWSRGRVVLLGDTAYCPTVNTGMGTSSTTVGAYILAGEIEKCCGRSLGTDESGEGADCKNLTAAFESYERTFRPFMDQVQEGVAEGYAWMNRLPRSSLGVAILNLVPAVASFFNLDIIGKWVLREDVKDWALPGYNGLFL